MDPIKLVATPPPPASAELAQFIKRHVTAEMRGKSVADLPLICELAMKVRDIEGDVAEVGVFTGGSAKLLQSLFHDRQIWLFDTFSGNPSPGKRDQNKAGSFKSEEAMVRKYLERPNTHICTGWFPTTAEVAADRRFAFVHLDCDQEQSVMDGCVFFWPRLNGVMLCDDYGNGSCSGARFAFDSYFRGVTAIHHVRDRAWVWQHTNRVQ